MNDELASSSPSPTGRIPAWLSGRIGILLALLGTMWAIEIVDTVVLSDRLQGNGIRPRTIDGLDGIAWSPFLHGGFGHLIGNTIPFFVLSGLTLASGLARYVKASAIIIVLGGALTWAFAIGSNENHIGASGWVFGLIGFLVAAAVLDRKAISFLTGAIALVFYGGTVLTGVVPTDGISWEGHLFGFIAGIAAAKLISQRRQTSHGEVATAS